MWLDLETDMNEQDFALRVPFILIWSIYMQESVQISSILLGLFLNVYVSIYPFKHH